MKEISQQHCAPRCAALGQAGVPAAGAEATSPTEELNTRRACVSSSSPPTAVVACRRFKAHTLLLLSKNALGQGRRKMCSFPTCIPFPCSVSKACDREDGLGPARHPAPQGSLCSGAQGCGSPQPAGQLPPLPSSSSPTLISGSLQQVSGPGNHGGNTNSPSGANTKQEKTTTGNSPVLTGGLGRRGGEVCANPVLV